MTLTDLRKTPWPWFGGKSDAASLVWAALGDVEHYVEPFAGSLAVLLRRPHVANRAYFSETVNDADGLLVNAWRSIQLSPDATADAASWPVSEADLHARHLALLRWRESHELEHLMGDPHWHDPVMAGWWIWGTCCWIGGGFCSGNGAWTADAEGRLVRREKGETGVRRGLPHVANDGKGVNHPGLREQGIERKLPHLSDDGKGVNHAGLREQGIERKRPHLGNDGRGVNHAGLREQGTGEPEFHAMTMPELLRWFRFLSARLRHVRIINGDWARSCTSGVVKSLSVRKGGKAGIFLDPPYSTEADRDMSLYAHESGTLAHDVRAWCIENGGDSDQRIVLAGYDTEHSELEAHGWHVVEWFKSGFLKGGMGNTSKKKTHQQHRERL